MGYGVVGSGVVEVLYKNHRHILERAGIDELEVKYILDIRDFPDSEYAEKFTKNFEDILNDDSVSVVVETMGGVKPAYDFVKRCLEAGKHVATSNKELVAKFGDELLEIAKEKNVNFLFEASVGGGIPIIRPMNQCLTANEIDEIEGILNGTTNFILTKMITEKMSFDDALKMAQELGYAERDPSADIDGDDACRKVCILASLAYGVHVYPDQVYTEGIRGIALEDVEYASSWGGVVKLLGKVKHMPDGRVSAMVAPAFVSFKSQLSRVDGVFNAILVRGDAIGDVVFYGQGAGKLPTASAVVADVIDCVKHVNRRKMIFWTRGRDGYVVDHCDVETAFYVRAYTDNTEAVRKRIENTFNGVKFIEKQGAPENEIAFVTPVDVEGVLSDKLETIEGIDIKSIIRVADC